jgi:hypothetical protein
MSKSLILNQPDSSMKFVDILFIFNDSQYLYNYTSDKIVVHNKIGYNIIFSTLKDILLNPSKYRFYNFKCIFFHFIDDTNTRIIYNNIYFVRKKLNVNNNCINIISVPNYKYSNVIFYITTSINTFSYFTYFKFYLKDNMLDTNRAFKRYLSLFK